MFWFFSSEKNKSLLFLKKKKQKDVYAWWCLLLVWCGPALAATPQCSPAPMLQPGKTLLLERVLVRPGGKLSASPDGAGGAIVPAFTALFVYGRSADGKFVQVGARSDCKPQGWMPQDALVSWRHDMVAAFTARNNRDRVLFFGTDMVPKSVLALTDTAAKAAELQRAASSGPAAAGIVAEEPATPVDINKQFYLLPILDAKIAHFAEGREADILHVASLTQRASALPGTSAPSAAVSPPPAGSAGAAPERHNFTTAVVFVLDATQSMDPYLDRSRQTLDKILAKVEAEHLQDRVRFGLVAFRDDPKAVPAIEYGTRVYADPGKIATRAAFDKAVHGLRAARVSSRAVAEDVYAGMETAIDKIDWSSFDGRFIVLVTDASAREPNSGIVSTKLDEGALAILAREKNIAILSVHLLTPEGGDKEHARAEKQYKVLSAYPGEGALYYPVPAGSVSEFGKRADTIANSLVHLIESAEDNGGARPDAPPPPPPQVAKPESRADPQAASADIAAVGYAMRMAYLGKLAGSSAPTMFDSYALNWDMAHHDVKSLDIRILMSKSQLSDLAATVSAIYDAFQKGIGDPPGLAQQLRSALLTLSRDPTKIGAAGNRELTEAALGEYLDGLPFQSKVMGIDQDAWLGMSPGDQQDLIDHLAVDLELYRHFEDDRDHWVKLAPDAAPEDAVYPVPLDAMP